MEKNKIDIKAHFKTMKTENWIILAIEAVIFVVFVIADSWFWADLAQGKSFLGNENKSYEIAVAIVVLILTLMMLSIVIYDLFFRNYVKEREGIVEKTIHNGRVIVISKESSKKEAPKDEKEPAEKK